MIKNLIFQSICLKYIFIYDISKKQYYTQYFMSLITEWLCFLVVNKQKHNSIF